MSFYEQDVTWNEFKKIVHDAFEQREQKVSSDTKVFIPPLLFRGQADSRWAIEASLSRIKKNEFETFYLESLRPLAKRVSSYTGKDWTESIKEIQEWFEEKPIKEGIDIFPPPGYSFMVYLRHLGYCSPLLDWTISPYIASYFAFADLDKNQDKLCKSSVFIFEKSKDGGQGYLGSDPVIILFGPSLTTHQRHYDQQCWYTVCRRKENEQVVYFSHQEAARSQIVSTEDVLRKFNFSIEEKKKALKELNLMGISFYTLFGTEEALVKTYALQKYILED